MTDATNYTTASGLVTCTATGTLDKFGEPQFLVVPTAVNGFHDLRAPLINSSADFKLDGVMKYVQFIVQAAGYDHGWFYMNNGTPYDAFSFNLLTGTISAIGNTRTTDGLQASIRSLGDGQFLVRCRTLCPLNATTELGVNDIAGTYRAFTGDGVKGLKFSSFSMTRVPWPEDFFIGTTGTVVDAGNPRQKL
jgi:hypothetical protein